MNQETRSRYSVPRLVRLTLARARVPVLAVDTRRDHSDHTQERQPRPDLVAIQALVRLQPLSRGGGDTRKELRKGCDLSGVPGQQPEAYAAPVLIPECPQLGG